MGRRQIWFESAIAPSSANPPVIQWKKSWSAMHDVCQVSVDEESHD
ncbi:MAG TPA: hypothetical protein IGS37_01495 [Synechococcales cyanobacterium M55_K2018_004]|nr:hypothetical protein [Synechococcales cyanobacterium M55_K2018_004]